MLRCEISAFRTIPHFPNIVDIRCEISAFRTTCIPHFPNIVDIRKMGYSSKGAYFTTKHVKRVHIRCRCTLY